MIFGWFGVVCVVSIGFLSPGGSIVRGAILDATTWPGTIENQADSLGFRRCILGSTVQGESGTRCCFVVCDSMISWGQGIMFMYYVNSLYAYCCCRSCTPWSLLLLTAQLWVPPLGPGQSAARMAHMAHAAASLAPRSRGRVGPDVVLSCVIHLAW